jgi:DNA-binding XRE family transcriptional regulator
MSTLLTLLFKERKIKALSSFHRKYMSTAKLDEDKLYVSVGKLIRTRRELLKMTQAKLAALVGLERTSITNIENGTQRLPLHVFYAVCAALDMKIETALPKLADD